MKILTDKIYIIVGVVIAIVLIFLGANASKCRGETCDTINTNMKEYEIYPKMIPEIINKQVVNNEIVLLDVREDFEWIEGHINGAKHLRLDDINVDTTKDISKNTPIYVYCRSGKRAEEAKIKLNTLGFSNVENVGGIVHWQERGGEFVK